MIQVDLFRLYNHFNPSSTPISSVPQEVEGDRIERKPAGRNTAVDSTSHPDHVHGAISSGGQPLDSRTQSFFEPRLGYDLSSVRIHTGAAASESASAVDARAYTLGNNIVFGNGEYSPMSEAGRHLLAHELAHVVQHSADTARSPVIHRFCINDAETCAENCGQPGSFVEAGVREVAPAREQRAEQIRDEPAEAMASGHSRRATNLETIAGNAGLLPVPGVYGLFVDNEMPRTWGAYRWRCRDFATWVEPYTGPPDDRCVFVMDSNEVSAGQYLTDPTATTLQGLPRDEWYLYILRKLTHELQHERFASAPHASLPSAACTRETAMYTDGRGRTFSLNYLLSELSAEISEFLPIYDSLRRTTPAGPEQYETMMSGAISAFDSKISDCGESIRGILRAIRCHCNCNESDFYIRDTVEFTTSHWPRDVKSFFNHMMRRDRFSDSTPGRIDRLAWPIPDDCIRACEISFSQCTRIPRAGVMLCLAQRSSCLDACR